MCVLMSGRVAFPSEKAVFTLDSIYADTHTHTLPPVNVFEKESPMDFLALSFK